MIFYYLNKNYNCILQMGGSDQWGNILSGVDLIRKINKKRCIWYYFTTNN